MDVIYKLPKENGGASAEGCVRYDQEQELTDEQQQQAKDNLGIEDPETQVVFDIFHLDSVTNETLSDIANSFNEGKSVIIQTIFAGRVKKYQITEAAVDNNILTVAFLHQNSLHSLIESSSDPTEYAIHNVIDIPSDAVLYSPQYLTSDQQQQARTNIGAASTNDIPATVQSDWNETDSTKLAFIKNKPTITQPENHQVLTDAPESDISCPAETKTQLCSLTIPEDGVYQISAAAVRVMLGSTQPNAMVNLELAFSDESESLPVASQFLFDRAGCIGIAANLHRNTTVKLFATCGETCTISRTTDKQRLTYLNAVRIGAIYSE